MITYFDLVEHLITSSFGGPQDAEQRDIRAAVQRGYRELSWIKDWQHYYTNCRILFEDQWNGTVTVNGLTVTKVSGPAFPADAADYRIRIGLVTSKIAARVSDTVLTLDAALPFPDGTAITAHPASVYRIDYPLPADFRNLNTPIDETGWAHYHYVDQDAIYKLDASQTTVNPPSYWSVIPFKGHWAVRVVGVLRQYQTLDFTYRRTPRPMVRSGHETVNRAGTVSAAGTTVTGVGTSFTSAMVGSVIRFGTASDHPGNDASLTPMMHEARVTAVASPTSLTMDSAYTASSVKYLISDPADVSQGMENALYSICEYWLARMRGQKLEGAVQLYQRDLRLAMESDSLHTAYSPSRIIWDAFGWRSPIMPDQG